MRKNWRHEKSYLCQDINISEKLPSNLLHLINDLQRADQKGDWNTYFDTADALDISAKNAYVGGMISKQTWHDIEEKYIGYANDIWKEEQMLTRIYNLDNCQLSDRNGTYGGASGEKEGILIGNEYWLVKYPKNGKYLRGADFSYAGSAVSEYLGSHVYDVLGYPVHDTLLGVRNDHVVVACKDLCDDDHRLIEFRQLKNTYNRQLSKELDTTLSSTGNTHFVNLIVNLKEIMIHLKYNPELQDIYGLPERFWDCVVVDGFINNNDRNNGNWGILRSKQESILSPVYDNGSSFSPNTAEEKISHKLTDLSALRSGATNIITAYSLDGEKNARFGDLLMMDLPELNEALVRVVPRINSKIDDIKSLIKEVPEMVKGHLLLSGSRKLVYCKELEIRLNDMLLPAYEHALSSQNTEEILETLPGMRQGHHNI